MFNVHINVLKITSKEEMINMIIHKSEKTVNTYIKNFIFPNNKKEI